MSGKRGNTGVKVAASGVSLFSGSLLLLIGLGVLWLGQCTSSFGSDVVEHDSGFGGATIFGGIFALGGKAVALLGGGVAVAGALVLAAGLGFGASLFSRPKNPPPPAD